MDQPAIDFTTIDFPSDKLTIKMFRKAHPRATDIDMDEKYHVQNERPVFKRASLDTLLGSLIDLERELAEKAFNEKLGLPVRESINTRDSLLRELTDEYISLKLAFGQHDSLAMLQNIEKQAESQARKFSGPNR